MLSCFFFLHNVLRSLTSDSNCFSARFAFTCSVLLTPQWEAHTTSGTLPSETLGTYPLTEEPVISLFTISLFKLIHANLPENKCCNWAQILGIPMYWLLGCRPYVKKQWSHKNCIPVPNCCKTSYSALAVEGLGLSITPFISRCAELSGVISKSAEISYIKDEDT